MTKAEMADIIANSPVWCGRSAEWLVKHYKKKDLEYLFEQLEEAEEEYYSDEYYDDDCILRS